MTMAKFQAPAPADAGIADNLQPASAPASTRPEAGVELRAVARLYGLPVSQVRRILNKCVTAASTSAHVSAVTRTAQLPGKVKSKAKAKAQTTLMTAKPMQPRTLDPGRIMAQEVRESFHAALRKEAQALWFSLVQPFEDSVVEFVPQEIGRQYVRGKIRLPITLSLSSTDKDTNRRPANTVANRRWSSGGCTYVTATLPVEEQLPDDEYELGVPVTVYLVRVRQSETFSNPSLSGSDEGEGDKEIAGEDVVARAQGVTASLSRCGERFVTLLAQAALPQHLLDRFDVRCTEREEGSRAVIGISSLDGTSLCDYAQEFARGLAVGSSSGSGKARLRAGSSVTVPPSDFKHLLQFLNETNRTQISSKLGGETVEYKLF
jgi:hypothetical protein